ncbi:GtrA family protein [Rhodobacteraceae bacterium XHP0102]|nr:GtrA family protein [Rhodobacteraceae bacterium XHP0102]
MKSLIDQNSLWLRARRSSLSRYLIVGGWSYIVVTTVTWALHELSGITEEGAFAAGILLALMFNVVLLKIFVFRSEKGYWETGSRFVLTSMVIRGIEFSLFWALLHHVGIYYLLASTVAMFIGATAKYLFLRAFIYRSS